MRPVHRADRAAPRLRPESRAAGAQQSSITRRRKSVTDRHCRSAQSDAASDQRVPPIGSVSHRPPPRTAADINITDKTSHSEPPRSPTALAANSHYDYWVMTNLQAQQSRLLRLHPVESRHQALLLPGMDFHSQLQGPVGAPAGIHRQTRGRQRLLPRARLQHSSQQPPEGLDETSVIRPPHDHQVPRQRDCL